MDYPMLFSEIKINRFKKSEEGNTTFKQSKQSSSITKFIRDNG